MNTRSNQRGFTLYELIVCIACLFVLAFTGFLVWAVIHFITKFW